MGLGAAPHLVQRRGDARAGMIQKNMGTTPLMVAAATSQFAQAIVIMENGADPNNCNTEGTMCRDMAWNNRDM